MIVLGTLKSCNECDEPTKKRAGTYFDCGGPGDISPAWDCNNEQCKRKQEVHAAYLWRCVRNGKTEVFKNGTD